MAGPQGPILDGSFKTRQRTQIRTAPAAAQKAYLERIRALVADPLCVLPAERDDEPKAIAQMRKRIAKIAAKGPGFFDKRDKGIVGAVANIWEVANVESVPRMADHKIAGQRRYYLQRGHVARSCSIGVQNHDNPDVLLWAYTDLAKAAGLHVFAAGGIFCNEEARPPAPWIDAIGEKAKIDWHEAEGHWTDGADEQIVLTLGDTEIAFAPKRKRNLHSRLRASYRGPKQRQPFGIRIRKNGEDVEPSRDAAASYRAGVMDDWGLFQSG